MSAMERFGQTREGKETFLFTIRRGNLEAQITDFGASLVSLKRKMDSGKIIDAALGYDSVRGYEEGQDSVGGCVGRNANRIAGAEFSLNRMVYTLDANEGENTLHSGWNRYEKRIWKAEDVSEDGTSVTFSLHSPDRDQGFPGNLDLSVTYSFREDGGLQLLWQGMADQDTVFNPTNHSYFNLNGQNSGTDICGHLVQIFAEQFTPVRAGGIPTGEIRQVAGTPLDFRTPKTIGQDIEAEEEQLKLTGGYDHNFLLAARRGELKKAAWICAPETGLQLEVFTDAPGLQFYTGNFLQHQKGKEGAVYDRRCGFAMESQYVPNAVNMPQFAQPILLAGERFRSLTVYRLTASAR